MDADGNSGAANVPIRETDMRKVPGSLSFSLHIPG